MDKKTKLMLVCSNSDEAGAPRHVERIALLFKEDFEVTVILGGKGAVLKRLLLQTDIKTISMSKLRSSLHPFHDAFTLCVLYFYIIKLKPDVIHGHSSKVGLILRILSWAHPFRSIFTVHGWSWRGFSPLKKRIFKFIELFLYNSTRCDYVFVSDQTLAESKEAGIKISRKRNKVIYNSVSNPIINLKQTAPQVPSTGFVIMPARVSAAKNHELLIKAYEHSSYRGDLVLAGQGTQLVDFVERAKSWAPLKFSKLVFLGEISNIMEYISASDGVFLCSKFEALPISLIEALSFSKKIVASNVGGVSEILGNGEAGLLCSDKISDWIFAFNSLDDSSWHSMQEKASILFREKFCDEIFYKELKGFYQS
jgi:glycosyltransferase involved in cell wall biosynthesis